MDQKDHLLCDLEALFRWTRSVLLSLLNISLAGAGELLPLDGQIEDKA